MTNLLKRIRTLLTAAPTYLAGAAVVVAATSEEIAEVLPTPIGERVKQIGVVVLAGLGAATLIVRRVAPVFGAARGLLPLGDRN